MPYGREHGHPTAEEAAAQLALADRTVEPSAEDRRVYAVGTLAAGIYLPIVILTVEVTYGRFWMIRAVLAVVAMGGALAYWEFRAGRVITRRARRLRGWGMSLCVGTAFLLVGLGAPPAFVLLGSVPCALIAALMVRRLG